VQHPALTTSLERERAIISIVPDKPPNDIGRPRVIIIKDVVKVYYIQLEGSKYIFLITCVS
jgi:hypothetical protein